MMKKIGLMGAQNTGKTTAAHNYKILFESLGYDTILLEETATQAIKRGIIIHDGGTWDTQKWIADKQIEQEEWADTQTADYIICDRTRMDPYVYSTYIYRRNRLTREQLSYFERIAREGISEYDVIMYFNPRPIVDPYKTRSQLYQEEIDQIFGEMIFSLHIPAVHMRRNLYES
jgi:hypothetical protein